MSLRFFLVVGLVLIVFLPNSMRAQQVENPSSPPDGQSPTSEPGTSDSAIRSAMASGISEFDESLHGPWRTVNQQNRYVKEAEDLVERVVRLQERNAERSMLAEAKRFAGTFHTKTLGTAASIADLFGTAGGHASVGDFRGAAVAVVDDIAEGLYAAGGAVLAGAVAGSAIGPLGTVGGAVTGLAGAVAGSLGYNAYISPDVTSFAAEVFGEPQQEYYDNLKKATSVERAMNRLTPLDEILVKKLTEKFRAEDELAAEAAKNPPWSMVTPPPFDAKGRKWCTHCREYH